MKKSSSFPLREHGAFIKLDRSANRLYFLYLIKHLDNFAFIFKMLLSLSPISSMISTLKRLNQLPVLNIFPNLQLALSRSLFPLVFPTKILYEFLLSYKRANKIHSKVTAFKIGQSANRDISSTRAVRG